MGLSQEINNFRKSETSQTSLLRHWFILPSVLFTPHLTQNKATRACHSGFLKLLGSWEALLQFDFRLRRGLPILEKVHNSQEASK
jgi:hypothetical protein